MFLYFEALNDQSISIWYKKAGDSIRPQWEESGYDYQQYFGWDKLDSRLDIKFEDQIVKIIIVIFEDKPTKGVVSFEGN